MILAYVGSARAASTLAELRGGSNAQAAVARSYDGGDSALVLTCPPSTTLADGARLGHAPLPFAELRVGEHAPTLAITRSGFGGRPMYLRAVADGVLASTDLGWMVSASRALDLPVTLDADALAARCAHLPAADQRSIYAEIAELPPGTRAAVTRNGWSLTRLSPPRPAAEDASAAELLGVLVRAVASAAGAAPDRIGVLTGGGLDSGALLAVARRLDYEVNAFAIDFAGRDSDRPYLAELCRAHDLVPCRVSVGDEEFALGDDAAGLPLTWPSGALEATLLARARVWGASIVLSGAFADACLDGDAEAASHVILRSGVSRAIGVGRAYDEASLAVGVRRAFYPHVRRLLPAPLRRAVRAIRRRTDRPSVRAFDGPRLRAAREDAWTRARELPPATEDRAAARLADAFFSRELGLLAELRAQEEALAGVLRVDPYLAEELVTFALSLRPDVLVTNGRRRGLFRDAVSGILPYALIARAGKASFRPLHAALIARDAGRDRDRFHALDALGVVDGAAANAALSIARRRGSEHDGELLSLLGVESWLSGRDT